MKPLWPEDAYAIGWKAAGQISSEELAQARQDIIDAGLYPFLQRAGVRAVIVDPSLPPVTDDSTADLFAGLYQYQVDWQHDTILISDRFPTLADPSILPATILHGAMHLITAREVKETIGPEGWRGLEGAAYGIDLVFHLLNGQRRWVFDGLNYAGARKALL